MDSNKNKLINDYLEKYSRMLLESKNIIFRGAPGTGKSYLAKEIAAYIISNYAHNDYSKLDDSQKKQVEFVQFHPSYDYSDFVEGLRPKVNDDGTMGFELQDGIFKRFVDRARKNYENAQKDQKTVGKELSVQEAMQSFFEDAEQNECLFVTKNGSKFYVRSEDSARIKVYIPENPTIKELSLNRDTIRKLLESDESFERAKDVSNFLENKWPTHADSYYLAIYKEIKKRKRSVSKVTLNRENVKEFVFIIDEINRGEISKIFGELFFAIDPGYRGKSGEISTQYSNLHSDPNEKFYIPENVYIIGTMNDIDRSVDSFDFAMRRRFRFVEIRANERLEMLSLLENKDEAIKRMNELNKEIASVEDLNENYQIGASYFLKLKSKEMNFDKLWTDYLQPLLQEYIQGMYAEKEKMERFAQAYGYHYPSQDDVNKTEQG